MICLHSSDSFNLFCSWDNPGWPDSNWEQRVWSHSPPGLTRQGSGYQEEQQLFYRREQIDSYNEVAQSRHHRSEHRFESRLDSARGSDPNPFHIQDQTQNLGPDDLRLRIRDHGGHWNSEFSVAYESRVIVSRTQTYSPGSSYRGQAQAHPEKGWGKRSVEEPAVRPNSDGILSKQQLREIGLDPEKVTSILNALR